MRQLALRARVARLTSLAAQGEIGGGGGRGSSARVAQLALVRVALAGCWGWCVGRVAGEWAAILRVLACRRGSDPTINMRWKEGGRGGDNSHGVGGGLL